MKTRNTTWIILAFLAAVLFAIPLQAGDLTFFVGGVNPGSINYQGVKTSLDGSAVFGARLDTNFVPFFGMEHTLAFGSDYLFPHDVAGIKETSGFIYNSNLIFSVPMKKVVPYFTVGAGLIHQYGDSNTPVGTKFAFNYGGGLKFPRMAGPLGLRFDMRGYRAGTVSNKVNMLEVSGGLLISFGK
jgi:hypothetical protein